MARVFVSHAGTDGPAAAMVRHWLVDDGHDVFLDCDPHDGIALGEEWERRLHERLRWADAVVCVLTAAYRASVWCTAEVVLARALGSRLLPVVVEPGVQHPLLTAWQSVDATDPGRTRTMVTEALLQVDVSGGAGWPDDRPPFPGLRSFDVDQHRVFFGRKSDVDDLCALLRSSTERVAGRAVIVVGPSGSGKSSIVRAGLLPTMTAEPDWWALSPFTPGPDPSERLIQELAAAAAALGAGSDVATVRADLERRGLATVAGELLLRVPGRRRRNLLIVVDQFEELLTQATGAERARFGTLLTPALSGPVHLVATLRPEFLGPLLASPELHGFPQHVHTVHPLRRDALRDVIEKPARLAGIDIDDELVVRLVADTDSGDALPLLAYTLAELADGIGRGGRLLTSRYEQLGGVRGALRRQADAALADATAVRGRPGTEIISELLRLVTVDEAGHPTRWRVARDDLPEPVAQELDAFVGRRLLTTDTEQGRTVIGVAHEAFLSAWSPLADAIADASSALRARRAIEQAAAGWTDTGSPEDLWERGQLAAAVRDTGARFVRRRDPAGGRAPGRRSTLVAERVELSHRARAFLGASIRRDRRRRGRSTVVLSVLLALAVGASVIAWTARDEAVANQLDSTVRQLVAQADAARDTDPRRALLLGIAAERLRPDRSTRAGLLDTLSHTRYFRTLPHAEAVVAVAVTPDGRTLAAGSTDGTVSLWDVGDPTTPVRLGDPLAGHRSYVYSVGFSPDGRLLASAGADRTAVLWNVTDPRRPQRVGTTPDSHTDAVHAVTFAPDGHTMATAGFDKSIILWDVSDPTRPRPVGRPLTGHTERITTAAFSPDGRVLATAGYDRTVILWDVTDPAQPRPIGSPLTGHANAIWSVAFGPDGRTLATAGADAVRLWDVVDPEHPRQLGDPLVGHASDVYDARFAPDGRTLATAGADGRVVLWDVSVPERARPLGGPLTGHGGSVSSVAFTADGRTLVSGSADRTVVLWDLADAGQAHERADTATGRPAALWSMAFAPGGRRLLAGGADGIATEWDTADIDRPRPVEPQLTGPAGGGMHAVAFSPVDPNLVATAGGDDTVLLWDVADPGRPRQLGEPLGGHSAPPGRDPAIYALAFAPDGRTLASAGADGLVLLWDVTDPARPTRVGPPLTAHTDAVYAVTFSRDGRTLASAGADTSIVLWDVGDPARPARLGRPLTGHSGAVYTLRFAPAGDLLASGGSDRMILLWDVTQPAQPRRLGQPLTGYGSYVSSSAFAPDGHTLAGAAVDGTVLLWDVDDPTRPRRLGQPLAGPAGSVFALAFTPDGRTLATAGGAGRVAFWGLDGPVALRAEARQRACAITGRGLDPAEWALALPGLPFRDTCTD